MSARAACSTTHAQTRRGFLDQLKIAHNIVVITYAAILGAIALGSALAFGLGGRDVAARMLEGAYSNVQQNKAQ